MFVSSITTNFPLPPVSPVPSQLPTYAMHLPHPSHQLGVAPPSTLLHSPGVLSDSGGADPLGLNFQMLSPLPDQRRDSHTEFEFPNIPAPSAFADRSRKNSMQEGKDAMSDKNAISLEGIEVRIQSSTDNLVDVCEDEPYMFEEKPIEERRESLPSLLDKSFTIDEDVEHSEPKSETDDKDQEEDSGSVADDSDEHEELEEDGKDKTETQDSDETDKTVRETQEQDEGGEDNSTPEADTSGLEEVPKGAEEEELQATTLEREESEDGSSMQEEKEETATIKEEEEETSLRQEQEEGEEKGTEPVGIEQEEMVSRREEPMGGDAPVEPSLQEVPLAEEEIPDNLEEEEEAGDSIISPPMERIVEGAEAGTEDEMEEEEKVHHNRE